MPDREVEPAPGECATERAKAVRDRVPSRGLRACLDQVIDEAAQLRFKGRRPRHIPALACVPAGRLGVAVATVDGEFAGAGDAQEPFSIQSISKVFSLALALELQGSRLWRRVSDIATDDPFDAVERPRQCGDRMPGPFLNAGALIVTDAIEGRCAPAAVAVLAFLRSCGEHIAADFDLEVAESELAVAHRNRAIAELLIDHDLVSTTAGTLVREYTRACSISMNCADLARAGLALATPCLGRDGVPVLAARHMASVNAMMALTGLYRASGSCARHAGIPAKSGVGGGVLAVAPGRLAIAAWSPGLDAEGNSIAGVQVVQRLATYLRLSVFGP